MQPTLVSSNRFRHRRTIAAGAGAVVALICASAPVAAGPAEDRFDAITGPLGASVVRPEQFRLDARRTLIDVAPLMAQVDGDRAEALVRTLAVPRAATSPDADRQAATDLVADTFRDAGYEPQFQSVVLPATGNDEPNVYAELPGTQCSDRVMVVGAHYDSVAPDVDGADDNASGVAGMFEIARALRDQPLPVTVRFVGWSYEEEKLLGSRVMATDDQAREVDVVGAVSFDMIGFSEPDIDPLTGLPGTYLAAVADPTSADLARAFGAAAYTYTPEFPAAAAIIDPATGADILRSDHASFVGAGYQGLLVTDTGEFRNENYHQPSDTVDTLDYEFLLNATRASLAGVATYGSSDQDGDGIADLCSTVTPSPPASTPELPVIPPTVVPAPSEVPASQTPEARTARPVSGRPDFTG